MTWNFDLLGTETDAYALVNMFYDIGREAEE